MFWESIKQTDKKSITIKSFMKWAKESNPEKFQELIVKIKGKRHVIVKDDNEVSNYLFKLLESDMIFCGNKLFYKNGNIWTSSMDITKSCLMIFVMNSNVMKMGGNEEPVLFAQNRKNAKNIVDTIIDLVKQNKNDNDFYSKFHSSTKGKLCFRNGVLDF